MTRLRHLLRRARDEEEGHVAVAVPGLVAATGAVVLGIGASGDSGAVSIIGGIVLGVGIMAAGVVRHRNIDYEIYERLGKLEK
jgi:hypothetical protein